MEHFLNMLPILYIYWASGLVVWSGIVCVMQAMVITHNKKRNQDCRRSDITTLFAVGMFGTFLAVSVFAIPQITVLFVEIALMLVLWYTVFLFALNHINVLSFIHNK